MDPEASSGPAQAGIQDEVNVIVAEPAWRRLVPRAEAVAARAARAAGGASGTVVLAADRDGAPAERAPSRPQQADQRADLHRTRAARCCWRSA